MILRHWNLHMLEICGKICIYVPHILPNSVYFPAYFASKSFAYFKKILCYKPASLGNKIYLCQAHLAPGWVTVCQQINHLGI